MTGRVDDRHLLLPWLLQNGMPEHDLAWFRERAVDLDIVGVNYYPENSVHRVSEERGGITSVRVWSGAEGMARAVRAFAARHAAHRQHGQGDGLEQA